MLSRSGRGVGLRRIAKRESPIRAISSPSRTALRSRSEVRQSISSNSAAEICLSQRSGSSMPSTTQAILRPLLPASCSNALRRVTASGRMGKPVTPSIAFASARPAPGARGRVIQATPSAVVASNIIASAPNQNPASPIAGTNTAISRRMSTPARRSANRMPSPLSIVQPQKTVSPRGHPENSFTLGRFWSGKS